MVRVSTDKQNTDRQHDALAAVDCIRVFEEKISGKHAIEDRPSLTAARPRPWPWSADVNQEWTPTNAPPSSPAAGAASPSAPSQPA